MQLLSFKAASGHYITMQDNKEARIYLFVFWKPEKQTNKQKMEYRVNMTDSQIQLHVSIPYEKL